MCARGREIEMGRGLSCSHSFREDPKRKKVKKENKESSNPSKKIS